MDEGKSQGLVQWINALNIGAAPINSLKDLHDGKVLLKLQYAVQNSDYEDTQLPHDRFAIIQEYLEVMYQINFPRLVDINLIIHAHDEQEIAKVALLLLCVTVVSRSHNIDNFIVPVFQLDPCVQEEVKELIECVITAHEPGRPLHIDFSVLTRRRTQVSSNPSNIGNFTTPCGYTTEPMVNPSLVESFTKCEVFSNSPQPTGRGSTGSLKEFMSPLLAGSAANSPIPFQSLTISSPQVVKRLMAKEKETKRKVETLVRQKDVEMRRLTMDLHSEKNLREDLEMDVCEKTKMIQTRDVRIKELENENLVVRQLKQEIEFLNDEKAHFQGEISKLKKKVDDQQNVKEHNISLEEENQQLMKELQQLSDEVRRLEQTREECETLRHQNDQYQGKLSEMELAMKQQQEQLVSLEERKTCSEEQLVQLQEMYRQQKQSFEDLLQTDKSQAGGESLGFITQKRVGELEIELEQLKCEHEKLKANMDAKEDDLLKNKELINELEQNVIEKEKDTEKRLRQAEEIHITTLQQVQDQYQAAENRITENYTEIISNLNQDIEILKQDHSHVTQEFQDKVDSLTKLTSDFEDQLHSKQSEIEALQKSVEEEKMETSLLQTSLLEMSERVKNSDKKVCDLQNTISSLTTDLQTMEQKHNVEVTCLSEKLNAEKISYEATVEEITSSNKESLSEFKTLLEAQITDLEKSLVTKDHDLVELMKSKEKLEESLMSEQNQVQTLKGEHSELKTQIASLCEEMSAAENQSASLKEQLEISQNSVLELKQELSSARSELQQAVTFKDDSFNKYQTLLQENKALQEEITNCKDKLVESETNHTAEIQAITDKYESQLKNKIEEHNDELKRLADNHTSEIQTITDKYESIILTKSEEHKNELQIITDNHASEIQKITEKYDSLLETKTEEHKYELEKIADDHATEIQSITEKYESILLTKSNNHKSEVQTLTDNHALEVQNITEKYDSIFLTKTEEHKDELKRLEDDHAAEVQSLIDEHKAKVQIKIDEHTVELSRKAEQHALQVQEISQQHVELQITQASEQKATVQQLMEQIKTLQHDSEEKIASIQAEKDIEINNLCETKDKEISELNKKITKLTASSQDRWREMDQELKTKTVEFQQQLSAYEQDKEEKIQSLKLTYEQGIAEMKSHFESEKSKYEEILKIHNSESTTLKSSLENQLSETCKKYQTEIQDLKLRNTETVAVLNEEHGRALEEQNCSFESRLAELMEKTKSDKEKICQKHFTEIQEQQESHNAELEKTKQDLELKQNQIVEELTESHNAQLSSQQEEWKIKLASKEQEFETELRVKQEEGQSKLKTTEDQLLSEFQAKGKEFNSKVKTIEEQYQSEVLSVKTELEKLKCQENEEIERLKSELSESEKQQDMLREKLDKVNEEVKELRVREYEWEESHNKCVQQMDYEFKGKENSLRQEYDELCANLKQLSGDKETLQSELDNKTSHINSLNEKLASGESHKDELISQLREEIQKVEENKDQLENDYKLKLEKLTVEMEAVYNNNTELQDIHDSITEELKEKNQDVLETRHQLEDKTAVLAELQNKISVQKNKYEKKMEQMATNMEKKINDFMLKYEERSKQAGEEHEAYVSEYKCKLSSMEEDHKREISCLTENYEDKVRSQEVELETQQAVFESKIKVLEEQKILIEQELADEKRVNEERMNFLTNEVEKLTVSQVALKREIHQQTAKTTASEERAARCSELERLNEQLLARELQQNESRQKEMKQASEWNAMLQNKLDARSLEFKQQSEAHSQQIQDLELRAEKDKNQYEAKLTEIKEGGEMREKQLNEKLSSAIQRHTQLKEQLTLSEAQNGKLQKMVEKLKDHMETRESRLQGTIHELEMERHNVHKYKEKFELLDRQFVPLQKKLSEEENSNKKLNHQVRSLEVQLSHAERQVKEYRTELDKAGTALLGDIHPNFHAQNKPSSSSDESILDDSLEAHDKRHSSPHPNRPIPASPYFLRSRHSSAGNVSQTSGDSTPNLSLQVDKTGPFQAITMTSCALTPQGKISSSIKQSESGRPISIKSKLKETSKSLRSLASLNSSLASMASTDSTRSANVPRGAGSLFSCEDEEDTGIQYEWNRLGELQRRNTLCLPHLKTCYPVETQSGDPKGISNEDRIRGRRSETTSSLHNTRKRRPEAMIDEKQDMSLPDNSKSARHSLLDQSRPVSMNTRQRHLSAEKTTPRKSPRRSNRRRSKSAGTPGASQLDEIENMPMDPRRESIAFNIENTPKALRRGLKRQTGFVRKNVETKSSQNVRKPLSDCNKLLQTGL